MREHRYADHRVLSILGRLVPSLHNPHFLDSNFSVLEKLLFLTSKATTAVNLPHFEVDFDEKNSRYGMSCRISNICSSMFPAFAPMRPFPRAKRVR